MNTDYKMYILSQEEVQLHYHGYDHDHDHDLEEQEEGPLQQVVEQEQLVSGCTVVHYTSQGLGLELGQGQMDHCQEQGRVHVVEHQNLWEQLVLESALHEDHDDSGGYLKCGCYVPISGLQFEHVEGYLEEFLTYNVLNVDINKKSFNSIFTHTS
jgi:hypothetical protein